MNSKNELLLSPPRTVLKGGGVLIRGCKHALTKKSLLLLSLIPILITFAVLFLGYGKIYDFFLTQTFKTLIDDLTFSFFGGNVLLWLAKFALKLLVGLVTFILFYIVMQLFYIPICSLLAEKVLEDKGILKMSSFSETVSFNIKMFGAGLVKAVLLILLSVICFVISFIPLLTFVPIYFALLVLSYDSFDYGLELYGLSVKDRFKFAKKESALINGHAGVLFLCSFIPGMLLISLPFSVIGASLMLGESSEFKKRAS